MTVSSLEALVETCFPERSLVHVSRPDGGKLSETRLLELDDGRQLVCKYGGWNAWTGETIEPELTDWVERTLDLPVPALFDAGTIRTAAGEQRYGLYERLDGAPLSQQYRALERSQRRAVVSAAGRLLGRLHSRTAAARVGGLTVDGDTLQVRRSTRRQPVSDGTLAVLASQGPATEQCRPVLTHGDYRPSNLLVAQQDPTAITGIIDWQNAHVTHDEYALARAEIRFVDRQPFGPSERSRLRNALREGYRSANELGSAYPDRAGLFKLLWLGSTLSFYLSTLGR